MTYETNILGRIGTLNGVPSGVPAGIYNGLEVEIIGTFPTPSGISDAYNQPIWVVVRTLLGKVACGLPLYCVNINDA